MATVDSKDFVDKLIAGKGRLPESPRATVIVEYTNLEGRRVYGIVFENEPRPTWNRYLEETQYVREPILVWTLKGGMHS